MLCCSATTYAQDDVVVDSIDYTTSQQPAPAEDEVQEEKIATPVSYNKSAPINEQWQKVTSDKAFGYKNEKEFVPKEETPKPVSRKDPWLILILISILRFFTTALGHVILWGGLAALVGYVLYRILSGDGRIFARTNRKMVEDEQQTVISEEDLLESDWNEKLRAAIAAGNTRMAIRYSYMRLLQILQARDLIDYRQDKTNTAYYHELSANAIRQEFRQLTRQYEYAWYGNYMPSTESFDTYMNTFNGVKKQLGAS